MHYRLASGLAVAAWLACARSVPAQPASPDEERHVVIVSLDGFGATHLEDEELELPHLRGLVRSGVWAASGESMYPATDHPAHTSLITGVAPGVHGVVGNRVLNRETGAYYHVTNLPRSESVRAPTLFDAAKARGLRTAAFFWPETREDPAIDVNLPLVLTGDGRADPGGVAPELLRELRDHDVPIDLFFEWYNDLPLQTTADRVLARAAAYVLQTYRPHLLVIRLPALDRYQHQYGSEHYLSKAAFTAADYNVGLLRRALEQAGLERRTTIFVVSDHGFQTVRYEINLYPLFRDAGLDGKVNLHSGYWCVFVELGERFDPARDQRALEDVLERALALEGVSRVVRPHEFEELGLPRYESDPLVLGQYILFGDVETRPLIDEDEGSAPARRRRLDRPLYGHGYLPSHERLRPVFLVAGRGVREGIRIGPVHNHDLAPTVSELLGLGMKDLPGRVLTEALSKR